MFVTFDSQTFRSVVGPHRHLRHLSRRALERVHAAVSDKTIHPVASEGMFTLEEIARADRARFLADRRTELETECAVCIFRRVSELLARLAANAAMDLPRMGSGPD